MFFDNKYYFDFVDKCRKAGITVPIIPGLKPISIREHLSILPRVFDVHIPQALVLEVEKCKTNAQVAQLGVEWAIEQSKGLKNSGVKAIHFYTMGKADNIAQIANAVY